MTGTSMTIHSSVFSLPDIEFRQCKKLIDVMRMIGIQVMHIAVGMK